MTCELYGFIENARKHLLVYLSLLRRADKDGKIDKYDLLREANKLANLKHSELEKCVKDDGGSRPISSGHFSRVVTGKAVRKSRTSKVAHAFSEEDIKRIKDFWLSSRISRVSPNKTTVVKRKSVHNQEGEVLNTYYRQYTITEAYKLFTLKYPGVKCCRESFRKYMPINVKKPQSKQDCCPICKEARRYVPHLVGTNSKNLSTEDMRALEGFKAHKKIAIAREADFDREYEKLSEGEALIIMDFKANITLGGGAEEDSHIFFSAPQRTVFGISRILQEEWQVLQGLLHSCVSSTYARQQDG